MNHDARITALETTIRRQRRGMIGIGIGLGVAMVLGMGQDEPKELQLEGRTIVHEGKPRIAMGTNPADGSVGIAVLDADGKARVSIGSDAKGESGIAIMDANQAPKIVMGSSPKTGAGVVLMGATLTELPAAAPK